jgi:hypothetical protein
MGDYQSAVDDSKMSESGSAHKSNMINQNDAPMAFSKN